MEIEENLINRILKDNLLIPQILELKINTYKPGFWFQEHSYSNEIEIACVLQGSFYVKIDEHCLKVRQNECLIIFPNVIHSFYLMKNESCKTIDFVFNPSSVFKKEDAEDIAYDFGLLHEYLTGDIKYLRLIDNSMIRPVLECMHFHYSSKSKNYKMLFKLNFCELILKLSEIIDETRKIESGHYSKYIIDAHDYILNFQNSKIALSDVANAAGISPRHLSRVFLNELGISVLDYISILRISKARELLEKTDMDITDIAFALGFGTSDYFTTFFKRYESISPSAYRKLKRKMSVF